MCYRILGIRDRVRSITDPYPIHIITINAITKTQPRTINKLPQLSRYLY